jgi:hypothetical protein
VGSLVLYTYEMTYAGAPGGGQNFTSFELWLNELPDHQMDIQTLDLDGCGSGYTASEVRIIQPDGVVHDGADTYESDEQYDLGGNWMWSSVNQYETSCNSGNGFTGFFYNTMGLEDTIWIFDGDPIGPHNPFSVRIMDVNDDPIPLRINPWPLVCGDSDRTLEITPADGYFTLNYLGSGPQPLSCWAANVNGDSTLTPSDGYHLLNYLGVGPELDCAPCEF